MKNKSEKRGMTLVEMLMAVVILLILITLTVTIGKRIERQSEEDLTRETISLIDTALGEFADFDYEYKDLNYRHLKFPLDCNYFDVSRVESALCDAFGYNSVSIEDLSADHRRDDFGCEVMYFILNVVPASRAILDKVDSSLVSKEGVLRINNNDNEELPLLRIVDSWGTTLHYSYYDNGTEIQPGNRLDEPDMDDPKAFPVVTSAGRDKSFGTDDDITNKGF